MDINGEQMVAHSIDRTTKFHDLVVKLWNLNHEAKLRKPLVGNLGATLNFCKTNKDRKDIEECFQATLLPLSGKETG